MNNNTIAHNIKSARMSAHLTQLQLAKLSGVNHSLISRYEHNKVIPAADVYIRLMEVCGYSMYFKSNEKAPKKGGKNGLLQGENI